LDLLVHLKQSQISNKLENSISCALRLSWREVEARQKNRHKAYQNFLKEFERQIPCQNSWQRDFHEAIRILIAHKKINHPISHKNDIKYE
jgi:threonine synthase